MSSTFLQFSHQATSATVPAPQAVRVFSAPSELPYTASVTSANSTWLLLNGASTGTGVTGAASQDLEVRVNPAGLPVGEYNGVVSVSVNGAATNMTLSVRLTVGALPQIVSTQGSIVFNAQAGTATSINIPLTSTIANTNIPYTASVSGLAPATPNWLLVTPPSGNTGNLVTITADATNLAVGLATGTVTFTSPGTGSVTIPVTLNISATSSLVVSPTATTLGYQINTPATTSRQISVSTNTGVTAAYTAQVLSGAWLGLSATPGASSGTPILTQNTPIPFYAVANPANLAIGTYEGRIRITSANTPGSTPEVVVTLIVSASPILQALPETLSFNYTVGTTVPAPQGLSITTTSGQPVTFTAAVTTTGTSGDWLSVSPLGGTSPASLSVGLNQNRLAQLVAGTYTGRITIAGAGASTTEVPVTLTISGSSLLTVAPAALQFSTQLGQTPPAQTFTVSSTDSTSRAFNVRVEPTTTNWLIVSPTAGNTGAAGTFVTVNINPNAITTPGSYEAFLVVTPTTPADAVAQRVQVRLTVTGTSTVTPTPTSLEFTQAGTTVPAAQTVTLSSTVAGLQFTAVPQQSWITITPASGVINTPSTPISVSVNPTGLQPGTINGSIVVSVSGVTTLTIPVKYNFQSTSVTVAPAQLTYTYALGGAIPVAQNLAITSTGGAVPFTATAATETGGTWLVVTPTSGTAQAGTPSNVAVTINPAGLVAGTYKGSVTITGTSGSTPVVIPVTITVTTPSAPIIGSVLNGGSNAPTSISPGLVVAIKGTNLGPTTGVLGEVVNGLVTTERSGVRVLFDNIPAPLLYVSAAQINVIAPYFLANRVTTRISIEYLGQRSEPLEYRIVETAPALLSADATGSGNGAFLNQNGTINSAANPAARGSVVVLYATGEGQTIPAGQDGKIITTDLRRPVAPVTVRIAGREVPVEYAGSAPTLVSGALQVNVRIPADLAITAPASVPVELRIGNATSATAQTNILLAVRP